MIADHVWRPMKQRSPRSAPLPCPDACAFMNCRKGRADHELAVTVNVNGRRSA